MKSAYPHEVPVLIQQWKPDDPQIISRGIDNTGSLHDIKSGQTMIFTHHETFIKSILCLGYNMIATGSWDNAIKYWYIRSSTSVETIRFNCMRWIYLADY